MALVVFYVAMGALLIIAGYCILPFIRHKWRLGLMVGFLSLGLYGYLGRYPALADYYRQDQQLERKKLTQRRQLLHLVQKQEFRLRQSLEQNPKQQTAWWSLGELYELKEELTLAAQAYKKTYDLEPSNLNILAHYLLVKSKAHKGILDKADQQAAQNLLAQIPNHPAALNLLGLNAYLSHQPQQAIDYWSTLQQGLPKDSKLYSELSRLISVAQSSIHH